MTRHYTVFDKLCLSVDQALRALLGNAKTSGVPYPAQAIPEEPLTEAERKKVAALMRINHAGEVCAQALYHGQGMVSRNHQIQAKMQAAAIEEGDHLAWCAARIHEMGSHTSYLNPLWYTGSFCIGAIAGLIGDKWSLGFVAETEKQVVKHLEGHIVQLPKQDKRSFAILQQMRADENEHREAAIVAGAKELPEVVKIGMGFTSKVMVTVAYWV